MPNKLKVKSDFVKYDRHDKEWSEVLATPMAESWLKKDTLDAWRHNRLRSFVDQVVLNDLNASWLTVGDGRFGSDASYLIDLGARNVHASDISDTLLKIGSKKKFINSFSAQNAEFLTFEDNSFDYVFCKDALHHVPRPYLAMHEMLRVSKRGVFLIEPRDHFVDQAPFFWIYKMLRRFFFLPSEDHGFESIGNYVYTFSEREFKKFLLGMHLTDIAFSGCNDTYISGVEFIDINSRRIKDILVKAKVKLKILLLNCLNFLGFRNPGIIVVALFKTESDSQLKTKMRKKGWKFEKLPINPYL
jgi:ubiquinone/menaquinone biosynthesis C-methylase UbiE